MKDSSQTVQKQKKHISLRLNLLHLFQIKVNLVFY